MTENPFLPLDAFAVYSAPDAPYERICEALTGFQIILFFQPPLTMQEHLLIMDAVQQYYSLVGKHLVSGQAPAAPTNGLLKRYKRINEPDFFRQRLLTWLDAYAQKYKMPLSEKQIYYDCLLTSAPSINEPGHFSLSVFMPNPVVLPYLGYLSLSFPATYIVEQDEAFIFNYMKKMCATLKPYHGMAGFAALTTLRHDSNSRSGRYVIDALDRHPGLNFINFTSCIEKQTTGILTVNWLNYINNELADNIGGRKGVNEKLTPSLRSHDLEDGLLIQSGYMPQLGDAVKNIRTSAYTEGYKLLKPLIADPDKSYFTYDTWYDQDGIYSHKLMYEKEMEKKSLHWPHRFSA